MKRVLVFVLSVGMLMSLCACGDDTFSGPSSAGSQSTGVSSTHTTETVVVATTTEQTALSTFNAAAPVLAVFNPANPTISKPPKQAVTVTSA